MSEDNRLTATLPASLATVTEDQLRSHSKRTLLAKNRDVFTEIYQKNIWGGRSKSGPGSTIEATSVLLMELERCIEDLSIRTLADAPCGTSEWIREITPKLDLYLGIDIVEELIEDLNLSFGDQSRLYFVHDITQQTLPKVDAILCRDCLVHLPLSLGVDALRRFVSSGSRYLLSTTFPTITENKESGIGGWRPLNLELAPYFLPEPLMLLRDRVPRDGDKYADKSIGVWDLASLSV